MASNVKISPVFFLAAALALLILPLRWVMGALLAALIHEVCHCVAVSACGGKLLSCSLGGSGARIETVSLSPGKEALCVLAGPAGSFLALLLAEHFPEAAVCGLIQGVYNLLPLYPLDGGRALACLLPDTVCLGIRVFTLTVLTGCCLWVMCHRMDLGLMMLVSILIPVSKEKFLAKHMV